LDVTGRPEILDQQEEEVGERGRGGPLQCHYLFHSGKEEKNGGKKKEGGGRPNARVEWGREIGVLRLGKGGRGEDSADALLARKKAANVEGVGETGGGGYR